MDNWTLYALGQINKLKRENKALRSNKKPALRLMDWEGTVLKEYRADETAKLTELPEPSTLNAEVDRELLRFQGWNGSLADIKAWVTEHEGETLTVGAIYTTTDGQDHDYWNNPRLGTHETICMQKRGTSNANYRVFNACCSLSAVNLPNGCPTVSASAFYDCR